MPPDDIILPTDVPQKDPYGDPKMWYQSTELWTAIIALGAFIAQGVTGNVILPIEIQASVVTILMFILRGFKTNSPIAWTKKQLAQMKKYV